MADINFNPALLNPNITLASQILGQQTGQANIANTNAATQGQQLSNAKAALQLQAFQNLQRTLGQQAETSPQEQQAESRSGVDEAPTLQGGDIDRGTISARVDQQFQQAKYIPSARQRFINAQAAFAGTPEIGQAYQQAEQNQWDQQMQQRQIGANAFLKQSYDLQDAVKAGNGIAALRDLDRAAADSLEAKAKQYNWSPDDLNNHVGDWANAVGAATFRHTGREISDNNGTPFDKQAGRPVPGGTQAPLSSQQRVDLTKSLSEPGDVDLGNGRTATNVPLWKRLGYPTIGAAETAYQNNPGALQGAQQAAGAAAPQAKAPQNAAPAPSNAAPKAAAAYSGPGTPDGVASAQAAAAKAPEQLNQYGVPNKALADPEYKAQIPQAPAGQKLSESDQQRIKQYNDNKDALEKDGSDATTQNARALQYFSAAKAIVDSPNAQWWSGLPGNIQAELARNGIDFKSADARFEAIKYLNNGALSGLKSTYGARPAAFDVKVNLEQTFPNVEKQGIGAVRNLVNENIRAVQYDLSTSRRITPYLNSGGDPAKFSTWNEQYAPRFQAVNDKPTGTAVNVKSRAEAEALAPGTVFITPDGRRLVR